MPKMMDALDAPPPRWLLGGWPLLALALLEFTAAGLKACARGLDYSSWYSVCWGVVFLVALGVTRHWSRRSSELGHDVEGGGGTG